MNKAPLRILAIAGSLRQKSINRGLARAAVESSPAGVEIELFDIASIPLYNGDVEASGFPEGVKAFRERIAAADALLITSPEYNGSIPGVLKNAIDWASRGPGSPLAGKPAGITGASPGGMGTILAHQHLRQVLLSTGMHTLARPSLYVSGARDKFDAEGVLTDAPTREKLVKLVEALVAWTRVLR